MEDFPILILFLILYLVAASSGKKKSKKKRAPMRSRAQGEQADVRARTRDGQTKRGFETAFADEAAETTGHSPCDVQQMHLHAITQTQMHEAQEGEDPCHVGGVQPQAEQESLPQEKNPLAQDVLRGVIMSEILMRPDERRALQRNRYHGT